MTIRALLLATFVLAATVPVAAQAVPSPAPGATTAKSSRIYLHNIRQGWLVKPARLDFCSSGCEYDAIRWANWNGSVAIGKGDFAPEVSGEAQMRSPVRFELSKPKTCPNGRRIYTTLKITSTDGSGDGDGRLRFNCKGWTY